MFVKYLIGKPNPNYKPTPTSIYKTGAKFKIYSNGEIYADDEKIFSGREEEVIDVLKNQAEFGKIYHFKITKNLNLLIEESEHGAFEFIGWIDEKN